MQASPRFSSPISQPVAPPLITEHHGTGSAKPCSPSLLLQCRCRRRRCGCHRAGILGTRKSEMPLRSRRRIRQAREYHVDDVVRHVVLAIGDVDLLARDPVGAVTGGFGAGARSAARSEPACGSVRFIVAVHSPRDQLAEIKLLQFRRRMLRQRSIPPMVSSGAIPKESEAAFNISMQAALRRPGSPCPPCSAGPGSAFQPGIRPVAIGLFPAREAFSPRPLRVSPIGIADAVERRDRIAGETCRPLPEIWSTSSAERSGWQPPLRARRQGRPHGA